MTRQEWDAAYAAWQRGEGARPPPRNRVVVKAEPPPWRDPRWRYEAQQPAAQPAAHASPQPVAHAPHAPPVRVEPHAPKLVAVASDIHWNSEAPSWRAFCAWHRDVRPAGGLAWAGSGGTVARAAALALHRLPARRRAQRALEIACEVCTGVAPPVHMIDC